jgi:hypothetical protein
MSVGGRFSGEDFLNRTAMNVGEPHVPFAGTVQAFDRYLGINNMESAFSRVCFGVSLSFNQLFFPYDLARLKNLETSFFTPQMANS